MKPFKISIIGSLMLIMLGCLTPIARADVCNPNDGLSGFYGDIYCDMKLDRNEAMEEKLLATLSAQYNLDETIIDAVLRGTACETVLDMSQAERNDLPETIKKACVAQGESAASAFDSWSVFTDIRNSYEKEKAMRFKSMALKFKFKASEQYWNGTIALDEAPFDLIVDLNLIEIILFGRHAEWTNNVFAFPMEEDEEGGEEETPIDIDLEEGGEEPGTGTEDTGDPGLTVEPPEGEEDFPPGCVPLDHEDADTPGPGSAQTNENCGNGERDILLGEQCDDGNNISGDGCSQYCELEENGSNDMCMDPDAITFGQPGSNESNQGGGSQGGNDQNQQEANTSECPEGYVPRRIPDIIGQEVGGPQEVPQLIEYPGPFIGGTLRQFPESARPPCGPNETLIEPESVGVEFIGSQVNAATDALGLGTIEGPVCMPSSYCTDPDDARDFLEPLIPDLPLDLIPGVPTDWKEQALEAMVLTFCVNITEANRPLSPYSLNDGCIDCHITHMVDALEEALATNVTPLKNTTSAFDISSSFGPNFSFNLSTAFKDKLRYQPSNLGATAVNSANTYAEEIREENKTIDRKVKKSDNPLTALQQKQEKEDEAIENILEGTELYQISNGAISDQEVSGRVKPLLVQMQKSFENIQSKFYALVQSTGLNEKDPCEP